MRIEIVKILAKADLLDTDYFKTADKILSLMGENKNRLASEVQATEEETE